MFDDLINYPELISIQFSSDFSLNDFKTSLGLSPYKPLPDFGKSLLFEKLGMSPYLPKEQCGLNTAKFNQTIWTDGETLILIYKANIQYFTNSHSVLTNSKRNFLLSTSIFKQSEMCKRMASYFGWCIIRRF